MAVARSAFLCDSVMVHDGGLISCLGIGISRIQLPALPGIVSVSLVVGVEWDEEEAGAQHAVVVRVRLGEELISRIDMPARAPAWGQETPPGTFVIQGISFDARRADVYEVVTEVDAEQVSVVRLVVDSQLPPL